MNFLGKYYDPFGFCVTYREDILNISLPLKWEGISIRLCYLIISNKEVTQEDYFIVYQFLAGVEKFAEDDLVFYPVYQWDIDLIRPRVADSFIINLEDIRNKVLEKGNIKMTENPEQFVTDERLQLVIDEVVRLEELVKILNDKIDNMQFDQKKIIYSNL